MKFSKLLFVILLIFTFTACSNNIVPKTEFLLDEDASIDDLDIKMTKAYINDNNMLEVVFSITNNRSNSVTLVADDYFKLYDINKVQIPNKYNNKNNLIKKHQTINYTLMYDVDKKQTYEIYFYSGIVENNIKFTINI